MKISHLVLVYLLAILSLRESQERMWFYAANQSQMIHWKVVSACKVPLQYIQVQKYQQGNYSLLIEAITQVRDTILWKRIPCKVGEIVFP